MQLSDVKNTPYIIHEDSDDYGAISSDEEDNMIPFNEAVEDEDSDDFDKEMTAEIQQSMSVDLKVLIFKLNSRNLCWWYVSYEI